MYRNLLEFSLKKERKCFLLRSVIQEVRVLFPGISINKLKKHHRISYIYIYKNIVIYIFQTVDDLIFILIIIEDIDIRYGKNCNKLLIENVNVSVIMC